MEPEPGYSLEMSDVIQNIFAIFIHLASMILFGIMIFFGVKFAYLIRLQISPALYLPKWLVFSIIPLSDLILMVHSLAFLLTELKGRGRDS